MIMTIEPIYADSVTSPWRVFCGLCGNELKKHHPTKWKARHAAASHLWAHRSANPPKPRGTYTVTVHEPTRKEIFAKMTAGKQKCPNPTKRRHISREEALDHIAKLNASGRGNPDYNAYQCVCGVWHVGHSARHFEKRIKTVVSVGTANSKRKRRPRR